MVIHQPDQAEYRSVLPEEIDRKPFPAFPPSARLAIVVGDPSEPGPYVIRVKVPSSTSCSFCWFVLKLYPTLRGMTDRDAATFKAHLEKAHGLRNEIEP